MLIIYYIFLQIQLYFSNKNTQAECQPRRKLAITDNQISNNSTPTETIHVPQDSNQLPNLIADITPSPKPHVSENHQAAQQQPAQQSIVPPNCLICGTESDVQV